MAVPTMSTPSASPPMAPSTSPCPACAQAAPLLFVARDVNRRLSETPFPYFRCGACGLIFLSPIPADLSAHYPSDYYGFPATPQEIDRAADHERYKIEIVQRFVKGGRLLEIGPSWGAFVHLAKRAGYEAEAIEMDSRCSAFIREKIGARVVHSADPVAALRDLAPYDVIALWHVVEHVPDPWTLLRAAADRLRPGGILLIAAPSPASLQFRLQGASWPHVDAPRHVALIPLPLLSERATALGLAPAWATTRDPGSVGWNVFGWEFFFGNLSTSRRPNRWLRSLGRKVAWLLSPLERREGAGSAYTAVFRKGERA